MQFEKSYKVDTLENLEIGAFNLDRVIERLISLREKYKDKYYYLDIDYVNEDYTGLVLIGFRQETDEEFQKRVETNKKQIEEQKQARKEREYKEYLRLKKKYDIGVMNEVSRSTAHGQRQYEGQEG